MIVRVKIGSCYNKIQNEVQSIFTINKVSVKDTNYYRCYVTNNYGNSVLSNKAFLYVTSKLLSQY